MTNMENYFFKTSQPAVYGPALSTGNTAKDGSLSVSQPLVYGPALSTGDTAKESSLSISQPAVYGPALSTGNRTVSSSTNIRGIDVAGISEIKQAIQSFIKGYQTKVASVGITSANIQQGIKGTSSEKQVKNLSDTIKNSVVQSLNKLNTFANQLDAVKASYKKADSSNTTVSTYINKVQGK